MNGSTRFPLSLLTSSETTAKGTGLERTAGKEDPIELDSSVQAVDHGGGVDRWVRERPLRFCDVSIIADGEFGWGGTSTRKQRRCPKVDTGRTETSLCAQGHKSA